MSNGRYWLLTIPHHHFTPFLPDGVTWIKGQLELGSETNFAHWQVICGFPRNCRLGAVKKIFGDAVHAELTRSAAADEYVHKDDTAVLGTRFELGRKPVKRNCPKDWDAIYKAAQEGRPEDIPKDILFRSYNSFKRIRADNLEPVALEREVFVYWGRTGAGKSMRAWDEAGVGAYPKDPRTKFWDGYREHEHVVIDEFRGGIDISHILRWTDRYPVIIEVKGSSTVLSAKKIWITSNVPPEGWYPLLDEETKSALLRRLTVIHFE